MTVKELIEKPSQLNPDATVYIMARDDDIALVANDVSANALVGKDETVLIFNSLKAVFTCEEFKFTLVNCSNFVIK